VLGFTPTLGQSGVATHEWIDGDEEDTTYTKATKSLRVVLANIQHGPKVL
jgi:hypothetical protein